MKKIRKITQNPFFITLLVFSFLFTSCNYSDDSLFTSNDYNKFSGKELYKSIFFANGEFAKKIDSYKSNVTAFNNMTVEQKNEFNKNFSLLVDKIEENNPSFFENFKSNLLSKDHQKVQNAIIEGGKKMYESLEIIYPNIDNLYQKFETDYLSGDILNEEGEIDIEKIEDKKDEYAEILNHNMISSDSEVAAAPCSWAVVCVAYFVLAVHNTAAVTALVVAVAAVKIKVGVEVGLAGKSSDSDLLEFEMLVDEIVNL